MEHQKKRHASTTEDDDANEKEGCKKAKIGAFVEGTEPNNILTDLASCYNNPDYSDITISIGGQTFHAIKAILSCRSPYFRAMFGGGFAETNSQRLVLDEESVAPKPFGEALRFMYTGVVRDLDQVLALSLLRASVLMVLPNLRRLCIRWMEEEMQRDHFVALTWLEESHTCRTESPGDFELYMIAHRHVLRHANTMLALNDFAHLSSSVLSMILRSDGFVAAKETDVLEDAITWLKADDSRRLSHGSEVKACIRLHRLTIRELEVVVQGSLFSSDDVLPHVLHLAGRKDMDSFSAMRNQVASPECPQSLPRGRGKDRLRHRPMWDSTESMDADDASFAALAKQRLMTALGPEGLDRIGAGGTSITVPVWPWGTGEVASQFYSSWYDTDPAFEWRLGITVQGQSDSPGLVWFSMNFHIRTPLSHPETRVARISLRDIVIFSWSDGIAKVFTEDAVAKGGGVYWGWNKFHKVLPSALPSLRFEVFFPAGFGVTYVDP